MTSSEDLGKIIGNLVSGQSSLGEQLSGDDSSGSISAFNAELVLVSGTITGTSFTWASNALIWDHPVNGDLDLFYWDAGYTDEAQYTPFPLVFPIVFGNTLTTGTSELVSKKL